MTPIMVIVFVALPPYFLIGVVGNFTGLTPAWAELVAHASTTISPALPFAGMLLQNLVAGAVVALILAIPVVRRCVTHYRVRDIAHSVGTSTAVAAFELSLGALALYTVLGLLIAVAISGLGYVLPVPGGYDTVVAPASLVFSALSGGGGGWPPSADGLSTFAVMTVVALMFIGIALGAGLWALFWTFAKAAASASATEAAGGGAAALGSSLALALTRGDNTYGHESLAKTVWSGAGQGALAGVVMAVILLAGAAVLGVG